MSKNEFDELLLKKLRDEELEYNPAHWDRLAQLLPPTLTPPSAGKGKKQWMVATGIAAAIALVLATVFTVQLLKGPADKPAQPAVAHQPQQPATGVPAHKDNVPPANAPVQPAVRGDNRKAPANDQQLAQQQTPASNSPVPHQPVEQPQPPAPVVPLPGSLTPQKAQEETVVAKAPETTVAPVREKANDNPFLSPAATAEKEKEYTYHADPSATMVGYSKRGRKTSISLGGGVNYGNLNTGYTAGLSVRHKIAGNLFVDGAVAMMYNNNANNVVANNGPPLSENGKIAARPTAFNNETTLASPALNPIQKLYYVQFNPSVGYQVEKHIALSVGGDFQRMLNRNDEIVQPESVSSKLFPNMDVGLTAKTEFSITPNIQAGLVFREGLNNLLRNDNAKYVNRRYVQVQFKYNIPVN